MAWGGRWGRVGIPWRHLTVEGGGEGREGTGAVHVATGGMQGQAPEEAGVGGGCLVRGEV